MTPRAAFARLLALLFAVYIFSFAVTRGLMNGFAAKDRPVRGVTADRPLSIGRLPSAREFSDVAQIPGGSTVLIVEDETKDSLLIMDVGPLDQADSPVREASLPAGFALKDMEGVAIDPRGFVYIVSSHSLNHEGKPRRGSALARLSPPVQAGSGAVPGFDRAETIADLRQWLESEIPEIGRVKELSADDGGLNIEGLAFDPEHDRLILGLRGPLFDRHPVLVPIRLKSPTGPFRREALELQPPVVLDGIRKFGVRSISFDPDKHGFWILTGGSGRKGRNRFHLWFWRFFEDGTSGQLMASTLAFDKRIGVMGRTYKLHPEGVCAVRSPSAGDLLMFVTDGSPYYVKLSAEPLSHGIGREGGG